MHNRDLAKALAIPPDQAADLPPAKRAALERLVDVADRLNRGEAVPGVIVCRPRPGR